MSRQTRFFHDAEHFLRAQILWPGEQIRWSGQPDIQRTLWFKWGHCLIGTVLLALALPLYSFPGHIREFDFFATLVVLGLFWMAITPARNYIRAQRTAYFVTDRRLFIVQNFNPNRITMLSKEDITAELATQDIGLLRSHKLLHHQTFLQVSHHVLKASIARFENEAAY